MDLTLNFLMVSLTIAFLIYDHYYLLSNLIQVYYLSGQVAKFWVLSQYVQEHQYKIIVICFDIKLFLLFIF